MTKHFYQSWKTSEMRILADAIEKDMTFAEIHALFPTRSKMSVQNKIRTEFGITKLKHKSTAKTAATYRLDDDTIRIVHRLARDYGVARGVILQMAVTAFINAVEGENKDESQSIHA